MKKSPPPKVLFDTNIISIIQKNDLLENLSKTKKILIYGNPVLLDETLSGWSNDKSGLANKSLQFILSITNAPWFKELDDLCIAELSSINRNMQYPFRTINEKDKIPAMLNLINSNSISQTKINGSPEYTLPQKQSDEKRTAWIDSIRKDILTALKKAVEKSKALSLRANNFQNTDIYQSTHTCNFNVSDLAYNLFYSKLYKILATKYIEDELQQKVTVNSVLNLKWHNTKKKYPYFSLFVKGLVCDLFYYATKPNEEIDRNELRDIEQLVYLKDLDIMVSNETHFMKGAFEILYGGVGKRYMGLGEFLKFLKSL
ncbi:MAG: hypothetical protein HZA48_06810 [Planctomycetes bacterium]|nr:hypothetical protein [Planctomycetota bacterium]